MKRLIPILSFILLVSCDALDCRIVSDDARVDTVLFEANLNTCSCVDVQEFRYPDPTSQAPGLLHSENFKDPKIQIAVAKILAEKPPGQKIEVSTSWGEMPSFEDFCGMGVSYPVEWEGYSLIQYHSPGGQIGAYVFRKSGNNWVKAEHLLLGYW